MLSGNIDSRAADVIHVMYMLIVWWWRHIGLQILSCTFNLLLNDECSTSPSSVFTHFWKHSTLDSLVTSLFHKHVQQTNDQLISFFWPPTPSDISVAVTCAVMWPLPSVKVPQMALRYFYKLHFIETQVLIISLKIEYNNTYIYILLDITGKPHLKYR